MLLAYILSYLVTPIVAWLLRDARNAIRFVLAVASMIPLAVATKYACDGIPADMHALVFGIASIQQLKLLEFASGSLHESCPRQTFIDYCIFFLVPMEVS
jgi:hypothetical protein